MARITQQSSIHTTGTSYENEPIIKSDGASSDVMQWLSNDESSNITISEDGSNNLDLVVSSGDVGIGTDSPECELTLQNDDATIRIRSNTTTTKGVTLRYNHSGNFGELACNQQGVNQLDMKYYSLSHIFGRNDSLQYLTISSAGHLTATTTSNNGLSLNNGTNQLYVGTTGGVASIGTLNDVSFRVIQNGVSTITCDTDGKTTVSNPGWPLKNELTNSGFDVWSNSTLEDVGSELTTTFTNQNFDTVPGSSAWNGAFVNDAGGWGVGQQAVSLTAGKLYKLSFDGSSLSGVATTFGTASDTDGADLAGVSIASATGQNYVFEASATTTYIMLHTTSAAASGFTLANVSLKEVTPGCVSSGAENVDGWQRRGGTATKCWRQHSDGDTEAVTKLGSFYSLKTTSTMSAWNHAWPDATLITDAKFLARFAGRTVTAGCWVYSTLATPEIRLNVYTGSDNFSTQTVEQNTWTWLEVTATCPDDLANNGSPPGNFQVQLNKSGATSETYYVSQVCLVLGSAIGSGNYSRPSGEVVVCEGLVRIQNNVSPLAADDKILNLEALSSGKIPKGCKAIDITGQIQNSAVTTYDGVVWMATSTGQQDVRVYPTVAVLGATFNGLVTCDTNGDIYQLVSEPDATLSALYQDVLTVHLR